MNLFCLSHISLRVAVVVVFVGLLASQRDVHRSAALRRAQLQGNARGALGRHAEECTFALIDRLGHVRALRNGGGNMARGVEQDLGERLGEFGVVGELVVTLVLRLGC